MNRKMAGFLMIAVVCGIGAWLLSSNMLNGAGSHAATETSEILVASRDLNAEEVLKPDLVKKATVPKESVPPGSFTDPKEFEDRWLQIKILEGEAIVDRKLAPKGTPPGLVARIPKGKRAFALNVNEQSGVSGFILPDHHVDVLQVKALAPDQRADQTVAETVLEDLLVLASGTTFANPTDRSIQSKTVTLAVTVEEAEILTGAQSHGQLCLALRGLNDHARTPPVTKSKPAPPPLLVAVVPQPKPEPKTEPKPEVKPEPVVEKPPRLLLIYRGGRPPESVRLGRLEESGEDDTGEGFPPSVRATRHNP
jgi:pilus assembly protein CpaB